MGLDGTDLAIWVVSGYVAIIVLVRLMLAHRRVVLRRVQAEIEAEQQRNARRGKDPSPPSADTSQAA